MQLDPQYLKFDRIVWNFPHAGFPEASLREGAGFEWSDGTQEKHIELLEKFF